MHREPTRRRTLIGSLTATLLGLALTGLSAIPAAAAPPPGGVRVYVLVIDGLRPDEVALMPQLSELAAQGTAYPESRSVMVAETIPNHVAMITGAYADKTGIPANDIPNRGGPTAQDPQPGESDATDAGAPELLRADSLFTLIESQCDGLRTAAVTSKDYLFTAMEHDRNGVGGRDVDSNFNNPEDPTFIPGFGLTPDPRTMTEAIRVSDAEDPDLLFINLGDVDRVGHVDPTGPVRPLTGAPPTGRTAALLETDAEIRRLVTTLKVNGKWASTRLLVTADHSMDWSLANSVVTVFPRLQADLALKDKVVVAQNGGASLFALRAGVPAADRPALTKRMRDLIVGTPPTGLDEVLYVEPNPADGGETHWVGAVHPDWHLTDPTRVGDLILTVRAGFRTSEPGGFSNPIPGNHGHTVTLPIFTVVSGGSGVVDQVVAAPADLSDTARDPAQAENVDMGTTAAWLLGVEPPATAFDGRVLSEAFTERPAASCALAADGAEPVVPESPYAVLLPLAALGALALAARLLSLRAGTA